MVVRFILFIVFRVLFFLGWNFVYYGLGGEFCIYYIKWFRIFLFIVIDGCGSRRVISGLVVNYIYLLGYLN